jgi:hypothetical protein
MPPAAPGPAPAGADLSNATLLRQIVPIIANTEALAVRPPAPRVPGGVGPAPSQKSSGFPAQCFKSAPDNFERTAASRDRSS